MSLFSRRSPDTVELSVSNRTVVRILAIVIGSLLLLEAISQVANALTLIFLAFFLAIALNAPVNWIAERLPGRRRGSRTLATAVSFFVVVSLLGLFLLSIVPSLVQQTAVFIDEAPETINNLRSEQSSLGSFIRRYGLEDQIDKLSNQISTYSGSLTNSAVESAGRITSSVVSVLTVIVLTYMMLIEGPKWLKNFIKVIPEVHHSKTKKLLDDMYGVVKGYVNGQMLLAFVAALLILPVLLILDISNPAALVLLVFVCGLIPVIGHVIGAVIVSTVALFTSPWTALIVLGYYITYQQIENYVIQPRVQASTTDMSPLLVFASVIIGVNFNGIVGGIVAIPIAGCVRILVLEYMRQKKYLPTKP
jgi:predicted PurR-regulated permease PerM